MIKSNLLPKILYVLLILLVFSWFDILKAQPMGGDWSCPTDFGNFTFTVNSEGTRINKLIFEVINWTCGNVSGSWTTTIEWPEPNGWTISNNQFYIDRVFSGEGWIAGGTFNQAGTEASGSWSYENGWGTVCSGDWGPIVITSINEVNEGIPRRIELSQNYPNPFNPSTTISYAIPKSTNVKIVLYNSIGEQVRILVNREYPPGFYNFNFDASNFGSGVYFYRIQAGDYVDTKKMVLIK